MSSRGVVPSQDTARPACLLLLYFSSGVIGRVTVRIFIVARIVVGRDLTATRVAFAGGVVAGQTHPRVDGNFQSGITFASVVNDQ